MLLCNPMDENKLLLLLLLLMVGCLENDEVWRLRKEECLSEVLSHHMQGGGEEYGETRLSG
jgi:hypothetical protein